MEEQAEASKVRGWRGRLRLKKKPTMPIVQDHVVVPKQRVRRERLSVDSMHTHSETTPTMEHDEDAYPPNDFQRDDSIVAVERKLILINIPE